MPPILQLSQGQLDQRLERCAVALWAIDSRLHDAHEDDWDALGWGDRRDYRLMAAAALRVAGVNVPTEEKIRAAADPSYRPPDPNVEVPF